MQEKVPLTNAQALAKWKKLEATGANLSADDVLKIAEEHESVRESVVERLMRMSLDAKELIRLLRVAHERHHEEIVDKLLSANPNQQELLRAVRGAHERCSERIAEKLVPMELSASELMHVFFTRCITPEQRKEVWVRLPKTDFLDYELLTRVVEWVGPPIRVEAGRLLLAKDGSWDAVWRVLEHVPELHDEVWPTVEWKLNGKQLRFLWDQLRFPLGWATDKLEELANVPTENSRVARWTSELTAYQNLRRKIVREIFLRFPTRTQLLNLVESAEKSDATTAAICLLAKSPTNVELRRIVRFLPELRNEAWKKLVDQGVTRADLQEIVRWVPELREEARAMIPPKERSTKSKPVPEPAPTPEPKPAPVEVAAPPPPPAPPALSKEADRLLKQLIGHRQS